MTTAPIRTWLDEHGDDWSERTTVAEALRAVLALCDASSRDHIGDGMGAISAGSVRSAIATALGVGL